MAIIFNKTTCPNCGAPLKIDKDSSIANCKCCGTDYILEETADAHLLTKKSSPKPLIVREKRERRSIILNNTIWYKLLCLIIGITLLSVGIYFISTCYSEYHIMLDDGEIICKNLYKCDTKFGNNFYDYKLAKTDDIETVGNRLYINYDDIIYELCITSMTEKDDGYIYLNDVPYFCVSTESYSVHLNVVRVYRKKYLWGYVIGILGLIITCPSLIGTIKSFKLK